MLVQPWYTVDGHGQSGTVASSSNKTSAARQTGSWLRDTRVTRGAPIRIVVNGHAVDAFEGEAVAVALAAAGWLTLRRSPTAGTSRGMFCLMGVCQECVVEIDGVPATACLEPVRDGMVIALKDSMPGRGTFHGDD